MLANFNSRACVADATVAELTRAQERSDQQLGEVMTLLHSIAQDVAALRGTTRVVVDADLGTTASTSDTSSSPPRQATVEDAQEIGASSGTLALAALVTAPYELHGRC